MLKSKHMEMLFNILVWTAAAIFLFLSFSPLKTSSEYRFTKTRQNIEGFTFLAAAVLSVFWSGWFIALGLIGIVLFKIASKND